MKFGIFVNTTMYANTIKRFSEFNSCSGEMCVERMKGHVNFFKKVDKSSLCSKKYSENSYGTTKTTFFRF